MPRKFAYFTDAHLGQRLVMGGAMDSDKMRYANEPAEHWDHLRQVLDDIAARDISDVVFGGDIGARGTVPDFFEILGSYDFNSKIVLGNHDDYDAVSPFLCDQTHAIQGKVCFFEGDPALKWLFLDSSTNRVDEDQLAWLKRELQDTRRLLLFLHHPVLPIDTLVEHAGATLRERDALKALLTSSQCDISLFCGHYHMADERREANIRQFCTPAVSYQIVKQAERLRVDTTRCGYRIVETNDGEIETEIVYLSEI
ncbi:metallophosphoesterase [Labrys sp. KB_33_2]|uniref:metallophosphoesterase family protein n=1 Tax=Labrys sp. KB_33_2 TaxID=3237479 RepID=UPI003F92D889